MTTKVWNLMYALGNTDRVVGDSENPQIRKSALESAAAIAKNDWRVWIEHHQNGRRIFESQQERDHRAALEAKRIVKFGEANVPGFVASRRVIMSRKKTPTAAQRTDLAPSDRGAQAYRDGLPLEANPFDIESDDAFAWQDGWDQAEGEASDAE